MNDGIIKGTGNSRLLKSNINANTTWEQFREALISGTVPIDLLFNASGWDVVGTALNKSNLLTDATAALLGLSGDPSVNDALSTLSGRAGFERGSYTGNGGRGAQQPNSLTFTHTPKLVIISPRNAYNLTPLVIIWGVNRACGIYTNVLSYDSLPAVQITSFSGNTLSWYYTGNILSGIPQYNNNDEVYDYIALW